MAHIRPFAHNVTLLNQVLNQPPNSLGPHQVVHSLCPLLPPFHPYPLSCPVFSVPPYPVCRFLGCHPWQPVLCDFRFQPHLQILPLSVDFLPTKTVETSYIPRPKQGFSTL